MHKTHHVRMRMSQRAISDDLVELARSFGVPMHDGKIVLNRKAIGCLLQELNRIHKIGQRALAKGGVVVVAEGDVLVTTYSLAAARAAGQKRRRPE